MTAVPVMAFAQNDPRIIPPPKQQKTLPEAPSKLPKVGADRTRGLDFLFGALKAAPDEASARHVEARIWALWMQTPSDTAALLMLRAKAAMDAQKADVAMKLLDSVIKLRPDYIEAWNRRATLYYLKNDYTRSLEDIRQVLIREPRHFGALAGLGMIAVLTLVAVIPAYFTYLPWLGTNQVLVLLLRWPLLLALGVVGIAAFYRFAPDRKSHRAPKNNGEGEFLRVLRFYSATSKQQHAHRLLPGGPGEGAVGDGRWRLPLLAQG
jgi:tetratricopeptide (TPR) repeat protein